MSKQLIDMGILAFRQVNSNGGFKPHLSFRFRSNEDKLVTFAIDTTRVINNCSQPDAYLITHAHSDHYGKSAMLSERAVCSYKTAKALEIRYGKMYHGKTMDVNDVLEIAGVKLYTFPTGHTPGSTAFYWENRLGVRILVTGDVKDYSMLPRCDLLVTEANYGDPGDTSCYFDDDIEGFKKVFEQSAGIALGAYAFGKAQRIVELVRALGYSEPISMESQTLELTKCMIEDAGELVSLNKKSYVKLCVVPPWDLEPLQSYNSKYVLSGRFGFKYPSIQISDHLDVRGLTDMVLHLKPKFTLIYHPKGDRPRRFATHLKRLGIDAMSIDEINNVLSNEFI